MQNESMKTEESNLFYNHTFMAGAGLSVRLAGALFGRSLTPGRFFKESYYENRRSTTSEAEEKPQTEFEAVQERILSSAVEKVFGAVRCLREPFQRRVLQRVLDSIEVESPDGQDQTEPSINQQSEDFIAAWLRKQPLMAKLTACMMSTWTYADHGTDKRAQEIFDGYEAEIMVTTMGRVHTIVDGCSFKTWPDIHKGAVETFLGGLSVKLTTHNGYITAFKHFCTWVVRDGRAEFSPVQYMDRVTVPDKEKRRPLGADEVRRLLRVTVNGPKRYGLTGMERAVLYRLGIETGFRRNELVHLTAGCFDLDKATVRLDAAFCKDRRDAQQPISMALASRLASFLDGKDPTDPVFALRTPRTALMIQTDAAEAGLPLMDDDGRELVFHSLRHTLREELRRARVSEAVIDHLMRHKPLGVGRRFYQHLTEFEIREAIERLPDYPWPADLQEQQVKKAVS